MSGSDIIPGMDAPPSEPPSAAADAPTADAPLPVAERFPRLLILLVAAAMWAATAPTLSRLEFAYGIENINVATALEILRSGRWIEPTLNGAPRVKKPPLAAWITAAAIRDSTLRGLDSADDAAWADALRALAWDARWPALLAAAAAVAATGEWARLAFGGRGGVAAAVVCASSLILLRHGRQALPDTYLLLFAALANAALAHALLRGRWWRGGLAAGVAVGLAWMCKGPVVLLMTVVPAALLVAGDLAVRRSREALPPLEPLLAGALAALLMAAPWFVWVWLGDPSVLRTWFSEVTREGALNQAPGKWYVYLALLKWVVPWTVLFVAGLALARRDLAGRTPTARGSAWAALATIAPLALMAIARDRKERYLLPFVVPAALVAARAVLEHVATFAPARPLALFVARAHLGTVLTIALGAGPLAAWLAQPRSAGLWAAGAGLSLLLGTLTWLVWRAHAARPWLLAPLTLTVMLAAQPLVIAGYGTAARSELRPLAAQIRARAMDAVVYIQNATGDTAASNLAIHLNRPVAERRDPAGLTPGDAPTAIVIYQDRRAPRPEAPTPQWSRLAQAEDDAGNARHVFLLPRRAATEAP